MDVSQKLWYQFSMRDLAFLILSISISLAWIVDHRCLTRELSDAKPWRNRAGALEKRLKADGWDIKYDSQYVNFKKKSSRGNHLLSLLAKSCEPSEVVEDE